MAVAKQLYSSDYNPTREQPGVPLRLAVVISFFPQLGRQGGFTWRCYDQPGSGPASGRRDDS